MILRHLASLCAAGMDYVEVFGKDSMDTRQIPRDLKAFLRVYASEFESKYDEAADVFEDDNYRIEFSEKRFVWKAAVMADTKLVYKTVSAVDFHGSSEKFYWIETLPMAILAYKQGYQVDYSDYAEFIRLYRPRFPKNSEKFARCEVLLAYMKKYFV